MSRALVYAPRAREDLDAIAGWLTQPGSARTARRKLVAIWKAIDGLREHPCRHPIGDYAGVRELPCARGYRVLYDVIPDTGRNDTAGDVRILRVFGPGRSRDKV